MQRRVSRIINLIILTLVSLSVHGEQVGKQDKNRIIDHFEKDAQGNLRVTFNQGVEMTVSKEMGRYDVGQESFDFIQIAKNKKSVGWLATYRVCAQSYACTPELVLLDSKRKLIYIVPDYGVVWSWTYIKDGDQVAIHYGFPHGDTPDEYVLYDAPTGKKITVFSGSEQSAPKWAKEIQAVEK